MTQTPGSPSAPDPRARQAVVALRRVLIQNRQWIGEHAAPMLPMSCRAPLRRVEDGLGEAIEGLAEVVQTLKAAS